MEFIESLDQGTWNWFQGIHHPWLNPVMIGMGWLALPGVLAGITLVAVVYLARRKFRAATLFGLSFLLGIVILQLAHSIIHRDRPRVFHDRLETPRHTPSFPCDQTLLAAVTFIGLGLLLAESLGPEKRRPVLIVTGVTVFLVGFSRLYVGQSFVSDVLAGWMVGTALALACRRPPHPR